MKPEKKAEKIVGYVLLALGLILIIIPAVLAIITFLNQSQIPQFIQIPTDTSDFVKAMALFTNACVFFFIFIVIVWAGSIITSRGVAMIKETKLKLVSKSLKETVETAEKVKES
jgi:TRAP-type C4-dicarboxylate transport system permease small subunit